MDRLSFASRRRAARYSRLLGALPAALTLLAVLGSAALAAGPSPAPSVPANADVHIQARALLGGHVRPGAWTAVDVLVSNDGPAVNGELRIRGQQQGRSQYGVEVQLAPGARQGFTLYAQTALFGSRVNVDLVSGEQVVATQTATIRSHDAYSPIVAVVAERPENLLPQINAAMVNPNVGSTTVITLNPADLPPRVEAWAAIDRLVWQDVDAAQLSDIQLEALRLWIGAGGRLVILGGTTGVATVRGFDRVVGGRVGEELLPFDPQHTVDVAPTDLVSLVGQLPADAATVPALAGVLRHGSVLARSGDDVVAAEVGYGRGVVTLVGFNPAERWIAAGTASSVLWHRLLPQVSGPALNPLNLPDDSQIVYALQNLPSVDLPPIEQLFVLLVAYIALIGPINYLILRRLDKREWAWVTIPALVAVFAVGSYGLGATLKGSDVIVNEISVVRAAQGTGRGIGQIYVGIYSPSRRTFDVRVPGDALLSNPTSMAQMGQTETPLDVLFGDTSSRLRNFEVGFGVLRGFRAEAPADAPALESDLRLTAGKLQGTITNRSDTRLENIALLFGGGVAVLPSLEPGESRTIDLDTTGTNQGGYALSERIFGSTFPRDQAEARAVYTRRAVIDQLFPYGTTGGADAPLLLAWRQGAVLEVELVGDSPNRVGEGLFMIPLGMTLDPHQVFSDQAMRRTIVATTADQGWGDMGGLYLSRGTMVLEAAPARFDGTFVASSLEIALTQGEIRPLNGAGQALSPLPDSEQPDQDDPVGDQVSNGPDTSPLPTDGTGTEPGNGGGAPPPDVPKPPEAIGRSMAPNFQLFDRTTQRWVEFPEPEMTSSYLIANPERYVDSSGAVLFRFVNRNQGDEFGSDQTYFQLLIRVEGTIE